MLDVGFEPTHTFAFQIFWRQKILNLEGFELGGLRDYFPAISKNKQKYVYKIPLLSEKNQHKFFMKIFQNFSKFINKKRVYSLYSACNKQLDRMSYDERCRTFDQ